MARLVTSTGKLGKLVANNTSLFLCDMQEKFRGNIQYYPQIIDVSKRLLTAFTTLDLPVICTEQYPKGLGPTVSELPISDYGIKPFDKTQFSMCVPPIQSILKDKDIKSVVLCGIEAHVCVQQTTLELLEEGYDVHLVADAVSSRSMTDRMFALQRLRDVGAYITTSEAVILGIAGGSHHPKFRDLQKIIWNSAPDTGLLSGVPSQ